MTRLRVAFAEAGLPQSAAMLLEWLGAKRGDANLAQAGKAMDRAIDTVLARQEMRTADLGGKLGPRAFGDAVAAEVAR